jgi:hypothetical protein
MIFVDGENFTRRGQEALRAAGLEPVEGVFSRRDVFLWWPRPLVVTNEITDLPMIEMIRGQHKQPR